MKNSDILAQKTTEWRVFRDGEMKKSSVTMLNVHLSLIGCWICVLYQNASLFSSCKTWKYFWWLYQTVMRTTFSWHVCSLKLILCVSRWPTEVWNFHTFSLELFFFFTLYTTTTRWMPSRSDRLKMHVIIPIWVIVVARPSLWRLAFYPTFDLRGRLFRTTLTLLLCSD